MSTLTDLLARRGPRYAAYVGLAIVSLIVGLHVTFPYQRLQGQLEGALGDSLEVTSVSIGPGWLPGDVHIRDLKLRTRPEQSGEKAVEIDIPRLNVDLGLLAAVTGEIDVEIEAEIGEGAIAGHVVSTESETSADFSTERLPLEMLPWVKSVTGGVPLEGGLSAHFKVTLPSGKWRESQGYLDISCESCTIGDGVAKIRPMAPGQTNAFAEGGLTLPKLNLGKIGGKIEITKGQGHIAGFEAKSPDGELFLEGDLQFNDPFSRSQVTAYLRFRSSDELRQRESRMSDMETFMAGGARRPDGYLGVSIRGPISQLRYVPSKVSPVSSSRERSGTAGGDKRPGGVRTSRAVPGSTERPGTSMPMSNVPKPPTSPSPEAPTVEPGAVGAGSSSVEAKGSSDNEGARPPGAPEKDKPEEPAPQPGRDDVRPGPAPQEAPSGGEEEVQPAPDENRGEGDEPRAPEGD